MKNTHIQFVLILISISLFSITTYSQDHKKYWKELNSTIELEDVIYDQCETGIRVLSPDSAELCIRTIDHMKEIEINTYITIPITYDEKEKQITLKEADKQPTSSSLYFIYKDWLDATHLIKTTNCEIYTQEFNSGKHLISGQLNILTPDSVIKKMKFCVFDYIDEIHPEVIGISLYPTDLFKHNKGEINIEKQNISMPYIVIDNSIEYITRIYLTNRIFTLNNPLDYAIRVNFNTRKSIPIGKFSLSDEIIESISIFHHGQIERAKTAILEIKDVKKKGYKIKYKLERENGEIIEGYFQGNPYSE